VKAVPNRDRPDRRLLLGGEEKTAGPTHTHSCRHRAAMLDPGAGYRPSAVPTAVCTPVDTALVPPKIVTLTIVLLPSFR
jgi:hypothetical protein